VVFNNPAKEDVMPYVTIDLREGRTIEQKRALVQAVTEAVVRAVNAKPEAVHVIIHDGPSSNFASGGVLLADRK
jgi:4-oxalocrotonate tautomerase